MRRLIITGLLVAASAPFAAAQAPARAEAAVRVEPVHLTGPRTLAEQTQQAVIRDYLESWKTMCAALESNNPALLSQDFVGAAKNKLTSTIHQQAAAGVPTRYLDRSHDLRIVFYSPEGLSIEVIDTVDYDMQVFAHGHLLTTQPMHTRYVAVLTPAQVRWQVRILQAE